MRKTFFNACYGFEWYLTAFNIWGFDTPTNIDRYLLVLNRILRSRKSKKKSNVLNSKVHSSSINYLWHFLMDYSLLLFEKCQYFKKFRKVAKLFFPWNLVTWNWMHTNNNNNSYNNNKWQQKKIFKLRKTKVRQNNASPLKKVQESATEIVCYR